MDVNKTPYFLYINEDDFEHGSGRFVWDSSFPALRLSQQQELRLSTLEPELARLIAQTSSPLILDKYKQLGRISEDGTKLEYNIGQGYEPLLDEYLAEATAPYGVYLDLGIGGDGRLAAAYSDDASEHGVYQFHLSARWHELCSLPEKPLRVCIDSDNQVWCVSQTTLYTCSGMPLPQPYITQDQQFEPLSINPRAFSLARSLPLAGELNPQALCTDEHYVYILVYDAEDHQYILRTQRDLQASIKVEQYALPTEAFPFVVDIASIDDQRLALMTAPSVSDTNFRNRDCPVVMLQVDSKTGEHHARVMLERYPMVSQVRARFVPSFDNRIRYAAEASEEYPLYEPKPSLLAPLQHPRFYTAAHVTLRRQLDSGDPDTIWHRLYIEGCIPSGCKLEIWAKVYNDEYQRRSSKFELQPEPLWNPLSSELPFHSGLLEQKAGESGLFEILLQRQSGKVRHLRGHYLQLRIRMQSDGRHSPAIHALRVYYPRFSYQEAYLPTHFHQQEMQQLVKKDSDIAANAADIRERMLASFEGVLTPLEGNVAAVENLIHPETCPQDYLPWVADLIRLKLPKFWPVARQRRYLACSGLLQKWRGTYKGLMLALDIITDGAVRRGQVVVVENFRLRRTMSTLLGVYMEDDEHPLTLGTGMSGNSIVGESLILSDEDARTFLSLFAPELGTQDEREMVKAFFDRYSHMATVLLHGAARQLRKAVEDTLLEYMPGHLQWSIYETDHPFVLGMSPLLGVDTFLEKMLPYKRVRLDDTYLGKEGLLQNPLALSPKDINTGYGTPL